MKKIAYLLIFTFLVSGCATAKYNSYIYDAWYSRYKYNNYRIEIISEPSGAKIQWNNEYKGSTPLILIQNGYIAEGVFITAYPSEPGQYSQVKFLPFYQPLPNKIYFNMYMRPTDRDINIKLE